MAIYDQKGILYLGKAPFYGSKESLLKIIGCTSCKQPASKDSVMLWAVNDGKNNLYVNKTGVWVKPLK